MVNRKRLRVGYEFRHFGKGYNKKKPGLYFGYLLGSHQEYVKLSSSDVIELAQWLNRYCAQYIDGKNSESFAFARAKARAVSKSIEVLESQVYGEVK